MSTTTPDDLNRPAASPVLAATKLHIPARRPRTVPRGHLVDGLLDAHGARLALIVAPAGSGKTSLLSEWHDDSRESRRFAWIALDRGDNDAVRFWDGVIAALGTVVPSLGSSAHAALHAPGTTLADHVLPMLINELASLRELLVLVLDDYHEIENPEIHDSVELLVERLPASVHVAIASRSSPPLPVSRWRARGQLNEVRADALRFSLRESASFLNDVLELKLASEDIARLYERTEGWAAGLQLAGLSLRGRGDHAQFIASFAGDDQQIVDYLVSEVLDGQPTDVRQFLLRSAILDRLCGSVCAAVTAQDDAGHILRELERRNLFLVPLDSRREWYRYHHLFADLLRHELHRTEPDLVAELHRRASVWYRQAGEVHEAIEHATAAGDYTSAIELITGHWYEFLQRGRQQTVDGWIDRLPAETVAADASLCLTKAWLGVNIGRLDEVDRWIEAAIDAAAASGSDGTPGAPLEAGAASLRAIHRYMDGDVGRAVAAGRLALDLERGGPASTWRPVGCPVLGLALHWHGRSDDASATLSEAVRLARLGGNHLAAMHASGGLAAISLARGDYAAAQLHAAEARRIADEHELAEHWACSLAQAVQGQLLAADGELEASERLVARAVELANRGLASVEIAYALIALASVRQRLGEHDDARELQRRAQTAIARCADPGILRDLAARLERRLEAAPRGVASGLRSDPDALSDAELSVLRLLRSELSQREIGHELHLSINTIKTHTRSIYRKLGVATRDEALARARELSLV